MCIPEVPDLYESVLSEFDGQSLVSWLVNPEEPLEVLQEFAVEGEVSMPILLDSDASVYELYPRQGLTPPFPIHVVVDRQGVVTYLSRTYDPVALREAIRAAVEAE